jgi:predicted dehydrogenase
MTMQEIPVPSDPVKVALIGAGGRASNHYAPLFGSLKRWIEVVAVCDPVQSHCQAVAATLGVPGYADIRQLVKDQPMEAALVVTPISSRHSISIYLSSNGVHNMCETSWCNTTAQAREMIETARRKNRVVRVAENFFRFPIDRFSHAVRDSGYIGRIGRIESYADHTGYHNNSRWIAFAQNRPPLGAVD